MGYSDGVFASKLRGQLAEKNMRQCDLAAAVGLSTATIVSYCRGHSTPKAEVVAEMAKALDCDPNTLLGWNK